MKWTDVAAVTGLLLCLGGCDADEAAHRKGYVVDGTIHWTDRRVTRAGVRRFLMIAASAHAPDVDVPLWHQIWAINHYVALRARELGMRFPRELTELDRTTVRYLLSKDERGDPKAPRLARKWASN